MTELGWAVIWELVDNHTLLEESLRQTLNIRLRLELVSVDGGLEARALEATESKCHRVGIEGLLQVYLNLSRYLLTYRNRCQSVFEHDHHASIVNSV